MRVLVACEESQAVTKAFRAKGHEAYSCDIQQCALYDHIEWHIVEDARKLINGNCCFETVNGEKHKIKGGWDLLIAHPPCTYLTAAGAIRLYNKDHTIRDYYRMANGCLARELFMTFYNARCDRICIENPVPMKVWQLPAPTQTIEPYMFGEPWRKRTLLWLKNLPALIPTSEVQPLGLWVGAASKRKRKDGYILTSIRDSKRRSKTFRGIAEAMAEQWGGEEDALDIGCAGGAGAVGGADRAADLLDPD